jgi:hypothetical protein
MKSIAMFRAYTKSATTWALALAALAITAVTEGAALFSDGFDLSQPLSNNWTLAQQSDSYVSLVDYSFVDLNNLFGVGVGIPASIPEAPHSAQVGGPATTGVVFAANATSGVAAAANLISNSSFNASLFTLQFDLYMSTGSAALTAQNSTEMAIWAVGRSNTSPVGYGNRNSAGNGAWGWLAGDNGVGSEDAAIFRNTTELIDIGDTFDPGAGALFDAAFDFDFPAFAHHSPLFEWVTVRARYDGTNIRVSFNGVEFLSAVTPLPTGRIAVGYADPFGSISSSPELQFGIIDNVILIPEPASAMMLLVGLLAMCARRRAVVS